MHGRDPNFDKQAQNQRNVERLTGRARIGERDSSQNSVKGAETKAAISDEGVLELPLQISNAAEFFQPRLAKVAINDALMKEAIIQRLKQDVDSDQHEVVEADQECIPFETVEELSLSFRRIYKIDNLQGFKCLVKLQLDNNQITTMEGLGALVNLEWLDLSFNRISKIEGLDNLVNLKDLSLVHNQIERISGLNALTNLDILALAHNKIGDLGDVKALRKLSSLRCVTLKGNPVCNLPDFRRTTVSYLKSLKYLDYSRLLQDEVAKAREEMQTELLELEDHERQQEVLEHERRVLLDEAREHEEANLAGIKTLFDDMLKGDNDLHKWRKMRGFTNLEREYNSKMVESTEQFLATMMERHRLKCAERDGYAAAIATLKADNESKCRDLMSECERFHKGAALGERSGSDSASSCEEMQQKLDCLRDDVMDLETAMTDAVLSALDEYENRVTALKTDNLERLNNFFRGVEDMETFYQGSLQELAVNAFDQATHADPATMDPELQVLFASKDVLMTSLSTSHDNHMSKILKLEESLAERETNTVEAMIQKARDNEYERNRFRLEELADCMEKLSLGS